ncbi:hypothetical protein Vafri_2000 [Volvox africanus]|nr:hypothetical protein Vafri_2000 [Volvox africanus]
MVNKSTDAPSPRRKDLWWNVVLLIVLTYLQAFGYAQLAKPFCAGEPHTLPKSYLSDNYPCDGSIMEKVLYLATRPGRVYSDYLRLHPQDRWVSASAACMLVRLVLALLWPASTHFKWAPVVHRMVAPLTLLGWVVAYKQEPSTLALWFIRSWPLLDCAYALVFPTTVGLEAMYGISSFTISALLGLIMHSRRTHLVYTLTTCVVSTAWIQYVHVCWNKARSGRSVSRRCQGRSSGGGGGSRGLNSGHAGGTLEASHVGLGSSTEEEQSWGLKVASPGAVDEGLAHEPQGAAKVAVVPTHRDAVKTHPLPSVLHLKVQPLKHQRYQARRDGEEDGSGGATAATEAIPERAAPHPQMRKEAPDAAGRQRHRLVPSPDTSLEGEDCFGHSFGSGVSNDADVPRLMEPAPIQTATGPPPPRAAYVPVVRLIRMQLKIHGADPVQMAPGYEDRISSAVMAAGYELESVHVRRGCIELVVNARAWQDLPGASETAEVGSAARHSDLSGDFDIGSIIRALQLDHTADSQFDAQDRASIDLPDLAAEGRERGERAETSGLPSGDDAWMHPPLLLHASPPVQPASPDLLAPFLRPPETRSCEVVPCSGMEATGLAVCSHPTTLITASTDGQQVAAPEPVQMSPPGRGFASDSSSATTAVATTSVLGVTATTPATAPALWSVRAHPRIFCIAAGSPSGGAVDLGNGIATHPEGTVYGPFHLNLTVALRPPPAGSAVIGHGTGTTADGDCAPTSTSSIRAPAASPLSAPTTDGLQLLLRSGGLHLPARVLQVTAVSLAAVELGPAVAGALATGASGMYHISEIHEEGAHAMAAMTPEATCTALQFKLELPYLPVRPGLLVVDMIGVATVPVVLLREQAVVSELQEVFSRWDGSDDELDGLLCDISTYVHTVSEAEEMAAANQVAAAAAAVAPEGANSRICRHRALPLSPRVINLGCHILAFSQRNGWSAFSAMIQQQLSDAVRISRSRPPRPPPPLVTDPGTASSLQCPLPAPPPPVARAGFGATRRPNWSAVTLVTPGCDGNEDNGQTLSPLSRDLEAICSHVDDQAPSIAVPAVKGTAMAEESPAALWACGGPSEAAISSPCSASASGSAAEGATRDFGFRGKIVCRPTASLAAAVGWVAAVLAESPRGSDHEDFRSYRASWRAVQAYVIQWVDAMILMTVLCRLLREWWLDIVEWDAIGFSATVALLGMLPGLASVAAWLVLPWDTWMRFANQYVMARQVSFGFGNGVCLYRGRGKAGGGDVTFLRISWKGFQERI